MNILAFDTSSEACSVALLCNDHLFCNTVTNKNTHSANLMPMINSTLNDAKISINEIDYIACVVGPGSFTGIRIGVSTAKGLGHGLNCKCIPINSLEALALSSPANDTLICSALDARSGQIYAGAYKTSPNGIETVIDKSAMHISEFIEKIKLLNTECTFVGIGNLVNEKIIQQNSTFPYKLLNIKYPSCESLVALAKLNIDKAVSYKELMPLYLREPQAVRMMNQGKLQKHV